MRFATEYDPKYPKAVETLEKDADVLLGFVDFPAEHWTHLLMAYKPLDMAQARWRRLDGEHLLPLVRAGIVFPDGVQMEGNAGNPKARVHDTLGRFAAYADLSGSVGESRPLSHLVSDRAKLAVSLSTGQELARLRR